MLIHSALESQNLTAEAWQTARFRKRMNKTERFFCFKYDFFKTVNVILQPLSTLLKTEHETFGFKHSVYAEI